MLMEVRGRMPIPNELVGNIMRYTNPTTYGRTASAHGFDTLQIPKAYSPAGRERDRKLRLLYLQAAYENDMGTLRRLLPKHRADLESVILRPFQGPSQDAPQTVEAVDHILQNVDRATLAENVQDFLRTYVLGQNEDVFRMLVDRYNLLDLVRADAEVCTYFAPFIRRQYPDIILNCSQDHQGHDYMSSSLRASYGPSVHRRYGQPLRITNPDVSGGDTCGRSGGGNSRTGRLSKGLKTKTWKRKSKRTKRKPSTKKKTARRR